MELQELLYQGNALLSWFGEKVGEGGAAFCLYLCKAAVFMGLFYLLYKVGFNEGRQGFGTAVGVVLLVIILVLNTLQQKFLRKREVQV